MTGLQFLDVVLRFVGGGAAVAAVALGVAKLIGPKWLDHWLAGKLETHKAQLGTLTEHLKHDLQREMLKAQLSTTKMHEVYGRLWDKASRAHGAVSGLVGIHFGPDFDSYDDRDWAEAIAMTPLRHGQRRQLEELMRRDPGAGLAEAKRVLRRAALEKARMHVFRTKNYAAAKSPFLSPAVRDRTAAFIQAVWAAWVEIHMNELPNNPTRVNPMAAIKEAEKKLTELEVQISTELHPGGKHVGIAGAVTALGLPEASKLPRPKE